MDGGHSARYLPPPPVPDRYLYADSEPFPHRFNFLATFRGFLAAAASTYRAVSELERISGNLEQEHKRAEELGHSIDVFSDTIRDHIEVATARSDATDEVSPLAEALQVFLKQKTADAIEARSVALQSVVKRSKDLESAQRDAMRAALDGFFLEQELSVTDKRLFLELAEDGYDSKVECQLPSGISVQFSLSSGDSSKWSGRRRVGDFVTEGIAVQAGMKKGFLGEHQENLSLSELIVCSVTLAQSELEVGLKKRPDSSETMTLRLQRRENGSIEGTVERPEEGSFKTEPEDQEKLATFWKYLGDATGPLLKNRSKVVSLRIDGESIYEPEAAIRFIQRYVDLFAPVVREIARRSPSEKELSLKIEHEDRRREELYLRKDELSAILLDVDAKHRPTLQPFGLGTSSQAPAGPSKPPSPSTPPASVPPASNVGRSA